MFGFVNVNKPSGVTSRRVVDVVQRLVRPDKAGHCGTLDPLATGVLVVGIGRATRLTQYVQQLPKQYRATFLLGRCSATEDIEGPVELLSDAPHPAPEELKRASAALTGQIEQRPPAFSALKTGGRRAYKLARAGQPVDLAPRTITIYRLEILRYEYPELDLLIECSGGTYVRSLGRDLARRVGTEAVMAALVRTAIGSFKLEESVQLDALHAADIPSRLLSPLEAVRSLPQTLLTADQQLRVSHGQTLNDLTSTADQCAALNDQGQLVAILERRDDATFGPKLYLG